MSKSSLAQKRIVSGERMESRRKADAVRSMSFESWLKTRVEFDGWPVMTGYGLKERV